MLIVIYIGFIEFKNGQVPQQENEYDCGTYVLHYSELFMRETPQVFTEQWFHASEATAKRKKIHNLILSLEDAAREKSTLYARRGFTKCSMEVKNILDDNHFRLVACSFACEWIFLSETIAHRVHFVYEESKLFQMFQIPYCKVLCVSNVLL